AASLAEGLDVDPQRSLRELLLYLRISRWDVLAFTDGSGSKRGRPGGYAAVYRTHDSMFQYVCGGIASTTSQEAEMQAVFELVHHLLSVRRNERSGGLLVQLVSDSKYVV